MKKSLTLLLLLLPLCLTVPAQNKQPKQNKVSQPASMEQNGAAAKDKPALPYDESLDAMEQIDRAVEEARVSDRYVLAQVGGNWCPWCVRFAQFADTNAAVHALIEKNFVYIHVNYSKGNKNLDAMKRLGNPGRFGYPVFVILNREGEVLHIQNSAYLEENKSYSVKKVTDCFSNWTEAAIETFK